MLVIITLIVVNTLEPLHVKWLVFTQNTCFFALPRVDNRLPCVQDTLMIWDSASKQYSTGPKMTTGRSDACGAAIDGKLYVAGGWTTDFESILQTVEVFDAETGEWSVGPPLPEPRCIYLLRCLWLHVRADKETVVALTVAPHHMLGRYLLPQQMYLLDPEIQKQRTNT